MLTLIHNAEIFTPDRFGRGCVVIGGGQIVYLGKKTPDIASELLCESLDLEGAPLCPGLIDCHVHITGGGGEDGFASQAPPVPLTQFTTFGVTSVVGLLGTDDETRSTANLLARVQGLRDEGLSAWCWTGGYHLPATTLTGSVRKDMVHIEAVIGLGELAISDHRSSQPTLDELLRLASEVHVAGLLTRKAGVLHLHLGDGSRGLDLVRQALRDSEIPARVFHPTHVNRRKALFEEACKLAQGGTTIDVTAFPVEPGEDAWSAADAWERFHQSGDHEDHFTISSDGGGCLPVFNEQGELQRMDFASSSGLQETLRELSSRGHGLDKTLPCMTRNVSRLLRLRRKGVIAPGQDADLFSLDEQNHVRHVMAGGEWMVRSGQPAQVGTFEPST